MTFATRIVFFRKDIANAINDMVGNMGWTFISITRDEGNGGCSCFVILFSKTK